MSEEKIFRTSEPRSCKITQKSPEKKFTGQKKIPPAAGTFPPFFYVRVAVFKVPIFWYFPEKSMFAVLDRSNHSNKAVFGNFYFHRCWVPCACGAACSYQFLQANTWPLYLTLTGFDQNQGLVHFGKLTPPQNGRIPKMQMPVFSGIFMFSGSGRENLGCGIYLVPFTLHSF